MKRLFLLFSFFAYISNALSMGVNEGPSLIKFILEDNKETLEIPFSTETTWHEINEKLRKSPLLLQGQRPGTPIQLDFFVEGKKIRPIPQTQIINLIKNMRSQNNTINVRSSSPGLGSFQSKDVKFCLFPLSRESIFDTFTVKAKTTWRDFKTFIYNTYEIKPENPDDTDLKRLIIAQDRKNIDAAINMLVKNIDEIRFDKPFVVQIVKLKDEKLSSIDITLPEGLTWQKHIENLTYVEEAVITIANVLENFTVISKNQLYEAIKGQPVTFINVRTSKTLSQKKIKELQPFITYAQEVIEQNNFDVNKFCDWVSSRLRTLQFHKENPPKKEFVKGQFYPEEVYLNKFK